MAAELIVAKHYDATGGGGFCTRTTATPNGCKGGCCPPEISLSGSGPDAAYDALSIYIEFCPLASSQSIHIVWDWFGTLGDQLSIGAWDGTTCSSVYNQGFCLTGSGSANATIPAGTWRLIIFIAGSCNAPQGVTDLWSLTITCN